jgi:hypothetical protein
MLIADQCFLRSSVDQDYCLAHGSLVITKMMEWPW